MFNLDAFERATFQPREASVSLPGLVSFFPKDAEPVFKVRGLTANELALAEESAKAGRTISDVIDKLMSATGGKDKAQALLEASGLTTAGETSETVAKRMEHIRLGLVEPALELHHIAKLGDVAPVEFNQIANKILELTGQGREARGKPKGSTKKTT